MRGKKPSGRDSYTLRTCEGTHVEVTKEIYLEWHRSKRREKYQAEKSREHGLCSLDALGGEEGRIVPGGYWQNTPEENALRTVCMEKLRESIGRLPERDAKLIRMLFFEEKTVTDVALAFGCSRKSIRSRRDKVLEKLREEMAGQGIMCGCF